MRWVALFGALSLLLTAPDSVLAVKSHDFKTCSQSGFCRRGRALSARAKEAASSGSWTSPYTVDPSSVSISGEKSVVKAAVKSSLYPDIKFSLELRVHGDGVVRVRMDEVDGLRKRYDEAATWALISEPEISKTVAWTAGKKDLRAKMKDVEVVVQYEPLKITMLRNGKEQVVLNGQGMLHMEHFRKKEEKKVEETKSEEETKAEDQKTTEGEIASDSGLEQVPLQAEAEEPVNPRAWFEGDSEDAYWEETFSTWTDTKPKGPESLSIDINFPNHNVVYGIPQHATNLALPTTIGDSPKYSDPYRLYNADVFEYLADSTMSLYGSIPVMHAHSVDSTVGVFHAVGSETWIDIGHASDKSTETHWISESGILDVFILPGPTPADVYAQWARLVGSTPLPAQWSLGYHQCRWNYVSSDDIRGVQKRFDEEDFPVDVFWLDIEYAEEHKYFIWDKKNFPDPVEMTNDVAAINRKMVVIIDPHLKRTSNYPVYQEAMDKGLLVKNKDANDYEGWCWSGSSSWLDMFNPATWQWYIDLYKTQKRESWSWTESTTDIHIWNDMNEPSVFNGPEITMPKDNLHHGGWEHRDIHNINGMLFSNLTSQAVAKRTDPPQRPFVLTRAFFAGSHRFGAMWTGDNLGTWEHMAVGIKMVLANGVGGYAFAGSDVGGFFGNPEPEMLVRWYQVGIFSPFLRAHAHIDTKRREPYLLDEPYKSIVRDILRLRYSMLPIWYTAFRETSISGLPVVRPHYIEFPKDKAGFEIDDQFWIGSSGLLVKPVTVKGAAETTVYIPEDQVYYDYFTNIPHRGSSKGKNITVPAALHQIPLFIRGGSILATRERPRRSSPLMKQDPFTLRVALSKTGTAQGELYLDDGVSYGYQEGEFVWREFSAVAQKKSVKIVSKDKSGGQSEGKNQYAESIRNVRVERVVVLGVSGKPKSVKVEGSETELSWEWKEGVLTIKDPKVGVTEDWAVVVKL